MKAIQLYSYYAARLDNSIPVRTAGLFERLQLELHPCGAVASTPAYPNGQRDPGSIPGMDSLDMDLLQSRLVRLQLTEYIALYKQTKN